MAKKRVAVIFGGKSSEHEVSRMSSTMVINVLNRDKYDVVAVGITKQGRWYLYEGDVALIKDGSWETSGKTVEAVISPDPQTHGLIINRDGKTEIMHIDAVIPALHGKNGEDGTIQGLLTMAEIPFVGCGCMASAACMDKAVTNTILEQNGIPQARFVWFYSYMWNEDSDSCIKAVEETCGYPCFVKPCNAGSSVGISKCKNREQLCEAVDKASLHDSKLLVEEGIDGMEIECAVLGNEHPFSSTVGEVVPAAEWYDYDAKYNNDESELHIPARLPDSVTDRVKELAVKAYRTLGCEGLSRVDFFVRKSDGAIMLNELNTLPGFTPISMYAKLMEFDGISNGELVDRLLDLAFERAEKK